jgi:hypothetical protein
MTIAAVVLLACNLAALLFLFWRLRRADDRVAEGQAAATAWEPLPPRLERSFVAGKDRLISVEFLNPLEMAAGQKKIAGVVGSVAPDLVRRLVYDQHNSQHHSQHRG